MTSCFSPVSHTNFDRLDTAILERLGVDSDVTNSELGASVGLSASAVHRRIAALEENGMILGYRAVLSDAAKGLTGRVFVNIVLADQRRETMNAFEEEVPKHPEITECHLTSGEVDYRLQILIRNKDDFERIHRDVLSRLPGVQRVASRFVIRTVKTAD